jgi:hypothetical protein
MNLAEDNFTTGKKGSQLLLKEGVKRDLRVQEFADWTTGLGIIGCFLELLRVNARNGCFQLFGWGFTIYHLARY